MARALYYCVVVRAHAKAYATRRRLSLPARASLKNLVGSVQAAEDGDAGVAEDMCDLSFAETGSIVLERKMEL